MGAKLSTSDVARDAWYLLAASWDEQSTWVQFRNEHHIAVVEHMCKFLAREDAGLTDLPMKLPAYCWKYFMRQPDQRGDDKILNKVLEVTNIIIKQVHTKKQLMWEAMMKNEPAKYQAGKEEIKGAQYTMMKKAFEVSQHWARNNKSFHEALVAKLKEARVDLEDDAIREGPVTEQFVECLINVFYDAWVQVNAQKRKLLIKASEEKQQKGAADGEQKGGAAAAGGAGGAAGGAGGAAAGGAKTPAASGAGGAVPPGAIVAGGPSGKIIIEPGTGRISSIDGEPLVLSSDDDKIYWNLHLRVRDLDLEAFVRFAKDSKLEVPLSAKLMQLASFDMSKTVQETPTPGVASPAGGALGGSGGGAPGARRLTTFTALSAAVSPMIGSTAPPTAAAGAAAAASQAAGGGGGGGGGGGALASSSSSSSAAIAGLDDDCCMLVCASIYVQNRREIWATTEPVRVAPDGNFSVPIQVGYMPPRGRDGKPIRPTVMLENPLLDKTKAYTDLSPFELLNLQTIVFSVYVVQASAGDSVPVIGVLATSNRIRLLDIIEMGGVGAAAAAAAAAGIASSASASAAALANYKTDVKLHLNQFVTKYIPHLSAASLELSLVLVDDDAQEEKKYQTDNDWDVKALQRSEALKENAVGSKISPMVLPVAGGKARLGSRVPTTSLPTGKTPKSVAAASSAAGSSAAATAAAAAQSHALANNLAMAREVLGDLQSYLATAEADEQDYGESATAFAPGDDALVKVVLDSVERAIVLNEQQDLDGAGAAGASAAEPFDARMRAQQQLEAVRKEEAFVKQLDEAKGQPSKAAAALYGQDPRAVAAAAGGVTGDGFAGMPAAGVTGAAAAGGVGPAQSPTALKRKNSKPNLTVQTGSAGAVAGGAGAVTPRRKQSFAGTTTTTAQWDTDTGMEDTQSAEANRDKCGDGGCSIA